MLKALLSSLKAVDDGYALVGLLIIMLFMSFYYWLRLRSKGSLQLVSKLGKLHGSLRKMSCEGIEIQCDDENDERIELCCKYRLFEDGFLKDILRGYERHLVGMGHSYSSRLVQVELYALSGFLGGHLRGMKDNYYREISCWFKGGFSGFEHSSKSNEICSLFYNDVSRDKALNIFGFNVQRVFVNLRLVERIMNLFLDCGKYHIQEVKKRESARKRLDAESKIILKGGADGLLK